MAIVIFKMFYLQLTFFFYLQQSKLHCISFSWMKISERHQNIHMPLIIIAINSCDAHEFENQTADFICKRQLLGENWTTDDSIEVITPMSNLLL